MSKIEFDGSFSFKYSPRPPAKASGIQDDVPKEEKERRLKAILDLQCEISEKRNKLVLGKTVEVLVDGRSEKDPSELVGRTRTNKATVFKADKALVGRLVDIKVETVKPHTLIGRLIHEKD
jgi:tRNA-2-methylthio-N6-dimethylallyladenosine synthase